jgi:hypothetical protein
LFNVLQHLFLLLGELLLKLFKLDVNDVEFFFVFYVCLSESVGELFSLGNEKFAIVLCVLI